MLKKFIKYGFQPINANWFRKSTNEKGKKLFDAGHVINVIEIQSEDEIRVTGQVVAQTRIAVKYDIILTLDVNRNLITAECTCKAGLSRKCKHISALLYFINSSESSSSKISRPQEWGKPSKSKLEQYETPVKLKHLFSPPLPSFDEAKVQPHTVTAKNQLIVDFETNKINVDYLLFNGNGLAVKENKPVYTQIQLLIYVTGIPSCDLFIYSPFGQYILINVKRNDAFLAECVQKLEFFYFKDNLPQLRELFSLLKSDN